MFLFFLLFSINLLCSHFFKIFRKCEILTDPANPKFYPSFHYTFSFLCYFKCFLHIISIVKNNDISILVLYLNWCSEHQINSSNLGHTIDKLIFIILAPRNCNFSCKLRKLFENFGLIIAVRNYDERVILNRRGNLFYVGFGNGCD